MNQLKFSDLRIANLKRLPQFKNAVGEMAHSEPDGSDWSPADWMVAVVGELGEAANLMKKIRRGDFATPCDMQEAKDKLQKEFADFITYADIMAAQFGIDLGEAVMYKFNEVSRRVDSTVFMMESDDGARVYVYDFEKSKVVD